MSIDPRDRVESVDERTARLANEARRDHELEQLRAGYVAELEDLAGLMEQRRAAEAASWAEADAVTRSALRRYELNPLVHMRTELAVRMAERGPVERTVAGLRHGGYVRAAEDLRHAFRLVAMVALELVERDKPTAEAKLERVRALAEDWLVGRIPRSPEEAASQLLDAITDR